MVLPAALRRAITWIAERKVSWSISLTPAAPGPRKSGSKLDKSTTSIVLNIAEGNGRFTGADQLKFYETAFRETIQSAALLDVAGGNRLELAASVEEGRELLRRVAAMLTALSKAVTHD